MVDTLYLATTPAQFDDETSLYSPSSKMDSLSPPAPHRRVGRTGVSGSTGRSGFGIHKFICRQPIRRDHAAPCSKVSDLCGVRKYSEKNSARGETVIELQAKNQDDLGNFYLDKNKEKLSVFHIWEDGGSRGDSVTPSTYSVEYRTWMADKLVAELDRNGGGLLGLGCGYRVLAIDATADAVELTRRRASTRCVLTSTSGHRKEPGRWSTSTACSGTCTTRRPAGLGAVPDPLLAGSAAGLRIRPRHPRCVQ